MPLRSFNIGVFSDAVSTIEALSVAECRLGIVTAKPLSATFVARELRDWGFPEVFETVITSDELGFRKPHPLLFESALNHLDLAPHDVAVVGDSFDGTSFPRRHSA